MELNSLVAQVVKNPRDPGSIPGLGVSPREGNGLENSMDRRGWWATVHGVVESGTTEQLIHGI